MSGCVTAGDSRDASTGSLYQVVSIQTNLLRPHNLLPDGTEPECQDAWNSQVISENSWKYGTGQEPVQTATKGWSGLQVFTWHWVDADTDGEWDVSEMPFSAYMSCVRLPLHEKGGFFQNIHLVSETLLPI